MGFLKSRACLRLASATVLEKVSESNAIVGKTEWAQSLAVWSEVARQAFQNGAQSLLVGSFPL